MKKTVTVLCAAVLTLTACGGGGDEPTAAERQAADQSSEAKANIKKSLMTESEKLTGTTVTEEQAECVSDGMVDEVGVEKLQRYELLDDNLEIRTDGAKETTMEKADAEALAAVFTDCVDIEEVFEKQFAATKGAQLSEKQQACIEEAIDSEAIEKVLADSFQGDSPDPAGGLQGELMTCLAGGSSGGEEMELPTEKQ